MIIIPARGGSKRIPNKNLVDLKGRPLISYVIATSLEITDNVYVSTDCQNIAACAEKCGANVIKRPSELATDTATTNSVIRHFLNTVHDINHFACVQATSPLLQSRFLFDAFGKMKTNDYDSVISANEFVGFFWDEKGKPINFSLGNKRVRTQDAEKWYLENGAFYLTSKQNFMKTNNLINGRVGFITMPKKLSFEIDDYEDLEIVERLCKQ